MKDEKKQNAAQKLFEDMWSYRMSLYPKGHRKKQGKPHKPHQSYREKARRVRQMERGII